SKDKSLEHLLKSKEIGPNDPLTRLYLADTYIALKQFDKAREEIDFVLGLDDDPRWISDVAECKNEAREMLQRKEFRER
ncbi:MAG: tetratricopeptide repeat protein, partial [Acidobacteriota bacterium]|nr:tetratricopeptide repeat protein [Acidobacteriota bacterium]